MSASLGAKQAMADALARLKAAGIDVREDRVAHARLPEFLQVRRNVRLGLLAIGHAFEELADLVGHLDQVVRIHRHSSRNRSGCA